MAPPPERQSQSRPDPSELAETMADGPAIKRPAQRPPASKAKAPDPALDDTAADLDAPSDGDGSDASGVDLESIYDRPEAVAAAALDSLSRYDPEAGRTSVAVKVRAVTEAVKNSIATPFGALILTLPVLLIGTSLSIAAVIIQTTPLIIAAGLVMPIAVMLVYWRYQIWLGHKRYMFRLLESLGEDMSDFDPRKIYRKAGMKSVKKRR